jgi:hypothetical protein
MILKQSQQEAADAILAFLLDPTKKDFILSGGPGYGKSWLIEYIVSSVYSQYRVVQKALGESDNVLQNIVVTATSNSAVDSLSANLSKHGITPLTIHKALNLRVQKNGKKVELVQSTKKGDLENSIVIIDEYTLIDAELKNWIDKGTSTSKIIYVGDKDQLLAVRGLVPSLKNRAADFTLSQPVRTNSKEILAVTEEFKKLVNGETIPDINLSGTDVSIISEDDLIEMIKNHKIDFSSSRLITSTNNRVIEFNSFVRSVNNLPDHFVPTERVTNNSYSSVWCDVARANINAATDMDMIVENHLGTTSITLPITGTYTFDKYQVSIPGRSSKIITHNIDSKTKKKLIDELYHINPIEDGHILHECKEVLINSLDLRSSFASTIYKAQGRSFDTVFIDLSGFLPSTHYQTLARSLYVGNSRAISKVYYVGELHDTLLSKLS